MKIWIDKVFTFGAGPSKGVPEIKDFQKISLTESFPTMNKRCLQRAWPPHQIRSKTILLMLKIPDKVNMSIFFWPKIPDKANISIVFLPKNLDKANISIFSYQRPAPCPLSHTTRVHCIEVEVQTGVKIFTIFPNSPKYFKKYVSICFKSYIKLNLRLIEINFQRSTLPLQQSAQAVTSRWHNPPYRTMYAYHHDHHHDHHNHDHGHDHDHHDHHHEAGRGVWHVQSTDGVRVWHCGGGGIVSFLMYTIVSYCVWTIVCYCAHQLFHTIVCYCILLYTGVYSCILLYTVVLYWK